MPENNQEIKITAEPQIDPSVCRFIVDREVFSGLLNCNSKKMAKGSPLLEALFNLPDIKQVMIAGSQITVAKASEGGWSETAKQIGAIIRSKFATGENMIDPEYHSRQPDSPELRKQIQEVFDTEINPGLAMHGGGVELVDVQGTTVFLTMRGGCQGCAAAKYTLQQGITRILKQRIPQLTDVVDATDHASGDNPYYQQP
jgi:Fe-S cluster biogenesis protein NfuA